METAENSEEMGMMAQAALVKKQAQARVRGEKVEDELPKGVSASEEEAAPAVEASAETTTDALVGEAPAEVVEEVSKEDEEPIRIAGKTFKTSKEAFAYAEQLEQEKLIAEAHAMGVREALAAQQSAQIPEKVEEDDVDTEIYTNPKEALRKVHERARDEAVQMIRAETAREKAWNEFLSEYPDIRRQDAEAILAANTKTIGVLPWEDGRKALAQAVYREYDEISNLRKPKTELTNKKPALSPSGGASRGVTPRGSIEKPLSFTEQLRTLRTKG